MKCQRPLPSKLRASVKKVDNTFIERVDSTLSIPEDFHWKLLGTYTEDLKGYLLEDDYTLLKSIIRNRDFVAYLGLSEVWGLKNINTQGEITQFSCWKARYHIASLLKKLNIDDINFDKQKTAMKKFMSAEKKCKFYNAFQQPIELGETKFLRHLLSHAKGFLKKLLTDKVPLRAVFNNAHHGPGANLDTFEGYVDKYFKYRDLPYSCTPAAAGYARFMIESDQRWYYTLVDHYRKVTDSCPSDDPIKFWEFVMEIKDHNKITFVPKNAKTLRSIAIEPSLNVMLQLGVDSVVKNRLKHQFNIDLSKQEINSFLSKRASIDGTFATIDLSAASDSIALKICKLLLPDDWYDLLMSLRCPKGRLSDGTQLVYEKVSSMGNGFTFALESAIFASIVYAVGKITGSHLHFGKNACVYGDDLIVPTRMVNETVEALEACGFSINIDKTFLSGNVRESCGTDWWLGKPIRPIFLKEIPQGVQDLFVIINQTKRHLELAWGIKNSLTCEMLLKWVPRGTHCFGPYSDEVFDSWLHSDTVPYENYFNCQFVFVRLIKRCEALKWPRANTDVPWRKLKASLRPIRKTHKFNKRISTMGQFTIDSKKFVVERRFVVTSHWATHYTYKACKPQQ